MSTSAAPSWGAMHMYTCVHFEVPVDTYLFTDMLGHNLRPDLVPATRCIKTLHGTRVHDSVHVCACCVDHALKLRWRYVAVRLTIPGCI